MTTSPLSFQVESSVARIALNRPKSGNAIDLTVARALLDAAIRCDGDAGIRCVVLTGAGKYFCVGGDIEAFASAEEGTAAFLGSLADTVHKAITRLSRMPKPLVVLVNGPAAGAGLSLAILGDIVLAARSAHFTAGYTAIGLNPDCGLTWWLPRVIGLRKAQELILTNRRVAAAEAAAIGLITREVEDGELEEQGALIAATLARSATAALGVSRNLLLDSFSATFQTQLDTEMRAIARAGAAAECREGIAAFRAKRKPSFEGV
jgi:2-(1,2-epoxy-1,2-dihydrophenyl)acetyl-CoA isomerase